MGAYIPAVLVFEFSHDHYTVNEDVQTAILNLQFLTGIIGAYNFSVLVSTESRSATGKFVHSDFDQINVV